MIDDIKRKGLLIVEWDDISTMGAWRPEESVAQESPVRANSVGWRLKAKRGNIALSPMRGDHGMCADTQIIPRGTIRAIHRVESIKTIYRKGDA